MVAAVQLSMKFIQHTISSKILSKTISWQSIIHLCTCLPSIRYASTAEQEMLFEIIMQKLNLANPLEVLEDFNFSLSYPNDDNTDYQSIPIKDLDLLDGLFPNFSLPELNPDSMEQVYSFCAGPYK